ncbi:MAG: thiamine pyrophosphate-binding protein [Thermomicrobiales bacterium]
MTALAHATTNCFPMILISGSSGALRSSTCSRAIMRRWINSRLQPLPGAYRILHAEDIGIGIARAIRTAVGRPGGVYLDLPGSFWARRWTRRRARIAVKVVDAAPRQIPAQDAVDRALDVLRNAGNVR